MTKLTRDAQAFASRVKMGSRRLWLLVEGKSHDRAFYDRILGCSAFVVCEGYDIRLAEQIELNGVAAGGKAPILALFRFFRSEQLLEQANKSGCKLIVCAVDRDFDDLSDSTVKSPHLIYTSAMDVEAEILLQGNLKRATSSALSLNGGTVARVIPETSVLVADLASRWRTWITYGAKSASCGLNPSFRYSSQSSCNVGGFGEEIPEVAAALDAELRAQTSDRAVAAAMTEVETKIQIHFRRGEEWRLLKGRWVSKYVLHLINTGLPHEPRQNIQADVIVKTCLETVDFTSSWASHYREPLISLLQSGLREENL